MSLLVIPGFITLVTSLTKSLCTFHAFTLLGNSISDTLFFLIFAFYFRRDVVELVDSNGREYTMEKNVFPLLPALPFRVRVHLRGNQIVSSFHIIGRFILSIVLLLHSCVFSLHT